MASRLYWIEGPWRGRLAIIPRPRGGDWLEDEVSDWRKVGIDVVVSFLTTDEVDELGLEEEEQVCQAHDLRFVSFPIPDQEVPPSKQAAESLVNDLEQALADGKNVALHCRQGIGRSATIAAALLVAAGDAPNKAFAEISAARGFKVPETVEQKQWVEDFAPYFAIRPAG